jgi:general L-amino acid transport system permease protein
MKVSLDGTLRSLGRGWWIQLLFLCGVTGLIAAIGRNVQVNLSTRNIHSGFQFMNQAAGFEIGETPWIVVPSAGALVVIAAMAAATVLIRRFLDCRNEKSAVKAGERRKQVYGFWLVWSMTLSLVVFGVGKLSDHSEWFTTIIFDSQLSYWLAIVTGAANTLKVSSFAGIFATLIGIAVGLCRTTDSRAIRNRAASYYVSLIRNIPLLVQLVFWYAIVLHALPQVDASWRIGEMLINNRGLFVPAIISMPSLDNGLGIILLLLAAWRVMALENDIMQDRTGRSLPVHLIFLGVLVLMGTFWWADFAERLQWELPELVFGGRNVRGGWSLTPEFLALAIGLAVYTSAFIAEITRAGVASVGKGQIEAARALGLKPLQVIRKVVMPQGLRLMIPPLTSQYLNCIKNSSLAVAVGYPDIVSVGGVILNQSGQALEVLGLLMLFYLTFNLMTSLVLNVVNRRLQIVGK